MPTWALVVSIIVGTICFALFSLLLWMLYNEVYKLDQIRERIKKSKIKNKCKSNSQVNSVKCDKKNNK